MIPLWLKLVYTICVLGIIVVYWRQYGPQNFLWFSDVALILAVPALWLEHALLASALTVAVVIPELFWNAGFVVRLLAGRRMTSLTDYMFDARKPLWLRALSLFHVPLPLLLLWLVHVLGYVPTAPLLATALAWIVLPLSYVAADPAKDNINWVFGWGAKPARRGGLRHVALLMVLVPVGLYLPTHLLLGWVFA